MRGLLARESSGIHLTNRGGLLIANTMIRQLAVSENRSLIAAGQFERVLQIWSWNLEQKVSEFETILDFGGRRLILGSDGDVCVAGSWKRGLAAYSVKAGTVIWHRHDLHQIQHLSLNSSETEIYCGFEHGPVAVIERATGTTLRMIENAIKITASPCGPYELIAERNNYRIEGGTRLRIPAMSFALAEAAFSPVSVCIAEPRAGIRCIDLETGITRWHHQEIGSSSLAYNCDDLSFYTVSTLKAAPYKSALIRLAPELTACEKIADLEHCCVSAFSSSGKTLVTTRGNVIETSTGKLIASLAF